MVKNCQVARMRNKKAPSLLWREGPFFLTEEALLENLWYNENEIKNRLWYT